MSDLKIKITDLYKIFGPNGGAHVDKVRNGVGKTELLEKHGHVLGLQNININIFVRIRTCATVSRRFYGNICK